jgi:hypothetical protein
VIPVWYLGFPLICKTVDYGYGSTIVRMPKMLEYQIYSGVVIPSNIHYISGTNLRALITGDLSIHPIFFIPPNHPIFPHILPVV